MLRFTHFFRNFFVTEKQTPQTFSLLECMMLTWRISSIPPLSSSRSAGGRVVSLLPSVFLYLEILMGIKREGRFDIDEEHDHEDKRTYVSTSRGSAMNRVTKNGIMAKTSTMFIPSWIMITMIETPWFHKAGEREEPKFWGHNLHGVL